MQDLLDRIAAAAPDPLRLTDDEFAKLSAYCKAHRLHVKHYTQDDLNRSDPLSWERSRAREANRKAIMTTLEYNRELRAAGNIAAPAAPPASAGLATSISKAASARKTGRPADTNPKEDDRIYTAWKTGHYRTYAELASELRITKRDVELAIDRHEKRLSHPKN